MSTAPRHSSKNSTGGNEKVKYNSNKHIPNPQPIKKPAPERLPLEEIVQWTHVPSIGDVEAHEREVAQERLVEKISVLEEELEVLIRERETKERAMEMVFNEEKTRLTEFYENKFRILKEEFSEVVAQNRLLQEELNMSKGINSGMETKVNELYPALRSAEADREELERQLMSAKERIAEGERQLKFLREENQMIGAEAMNYTRIIETLERKMEKQRLEDEENRFEMKERLTESERQIQKLVQELADVQELRRRAERRAEEATRLETEDSRKGLRIEELEQSIISLTSENERLGCLLKAKDVQREEHHAQMIGLRKDLIDRTKELEAALGSLGEAERQKERELALMRTSFEERVQALTRRKDELEEEAERARRECERLDAMAAQTEREFAEEKRVALSDLTNQHERELKEDRERVRAAYEEELTQLRAKASRVEEIAVLERRCAEAENAASDLRHRCEHLRTDVLLLSFENERLGMIFVEKLYTIESMKSEAEGLSSLLQAREREVNELRLQNERLQLSCGEQVDSMVVEVETLRKENRNLEQLRLKTKSELEAAEARVMELMHKLKVSEEAAREADHTRQKLQLAEIDSKMLRSEIEQVKQRHQLDINEVQLSSTKTKNALESHIAELRNNETRMQNDLSRVYELLSKSKKESEAANKENEELRREVFKLSSERASQESEGQRWKDQSTLLMNEVDALVKDRDTYKALVEANNEELEHKNKELTDKILELDIIQRKYEEALRSMEGEASELMKKLTLKRSAVLTDSTLLEQSSKSTS
eukprot:TRINITY_DN2195_c0_g2_i3.p1 TRINITY_DN2195_c0_g2~~TRINITY_DN2195_c0_g2_i3.p1  ORF type:complete len:778 (-),score=307.02 TRINITY_DN2195_c0_g2_i3:132-2465(-)